MVLKIQLFVIFITIVCFVSCKQGVERVLKIEGKEITIDSSYSESDSIDGFIAPYRNHINAVLDSALAYAKWPISREEGRYNTPAGNLMADLILSEASPIFKSRTGKEIDFVLLNFGGIRSIISEGKVTARTAYEVMPFENSIEVVELSGSSVNKLIDYLLNSEKPHPISGMQIVLNKNGKLHSVNIQGKRFDQKRNYNVATSNYLITGGDHMDFFKEGLKVTATDYLIRNAMIDYFKKVDTLAPKIDDRFYQLK